MLLSFPTIVGTGALAAGGLLAYYATYAVRSQLLAQPTGMDAMIRGKSR